jgi:two-component system response regulator VicR
VKDGSASAPLVLIVEDERPLADILRQNLERAGYEVAVAYAGPEAIAAFSARTPALVVLDIMLPKLDGFAVCEAIRARSNVAVLILTAKDAEEDKLRGFEVGADDYLTKPFSVRELLARVKALLRRAPADDGEVLRNEDLEVDPRARTCRKAGHAIDLSVREFDLLTFLMRRPGQLFSREHLLTEVWGYEYLGDSARTVDVTVWRLRNKVEDDPREPRYILSRRGAGYLFRPQG